MRAAMRMLTMSPTASGRTRRGPVLTNIGKVHSARVKWSSMWSPRPKIMPGFNTVHSSLEARTISSAAHFVS